MSIVETNEDEFNLNKSIKIKHTIDTTNGETYVITISKSKNEIVLDYDEIVEKIGENLNLNNTIINIIINCKKMSDVVVKNFKKLSSLTVLHEINNFSLIFESCKFKRGFDLSINENNDVDNINNICLKKCHIKDENSLCEMSLSNNKLNKTINVNFENCEMIKIPEIKNTFEIKCNVFRIENCTFENEELTLKNNFVQISFNKNSLKTNNSLLFANLHNLKDIYAKNNGNLKTMIVENCANLNSLVCEKNQLTNLNIFDSNSLNYLNCGKNKLTTLNLHDCVDIESLYCDENEITSLNVSNFKKLLGLYCMKNLINTLNVSGCDKLYYLMCYVNKIVDLDISNLKNLNTVHCNYNNKMRKLNAHGCTKLISLRTNNNSLVNLNLSGCVLLKELFFEHNHLPEIDVSDLTQLQMLQCNNNNMKKLVLEDCVQLKELNCKNNKIKILNLNNNNMLKKLMIDDETVICVNETLNVIININNSLKTKHEIRDFIKIMNDKCEEQYDDAFEKSSISKLPINVHSFIGEYANIRTKKFTNKTHSKGGKKQFKKNITKKHNKRIHS